MTQNPDPIIVNVQSEGEEEEDESYEEN